MPLPLKWRATFELPTFVGVVGDRGELLPTLDPESADAELARAALLIVMCEGEDHTGQVQLLRFGVDPMAVGTFPWDGGRAGAESIIRARLDLGNCRGHLASSLRRRIGR